MELTTLFQKREKKKKEKKKKMKPAAIDVFVCQGSVGFRLGH